MRFAIMPIGTLVRWDNSKRFGFIQPKDGSTDMFYHVSALADGDGSVIEGDMVSYSVVHDEKKGKDRASDVVLAYGNERGINMSK